MKQDRKLLDLARDQACVACGVQDGTIVAAHYFGPRRHSYRGGMGTKGHPLIHAHLCMKCHDEQDRLSRDKGERWEVSEQMLHYCALTLIRLYDQGKLRT